jgi:DNA-binding MarR family transcriptional regulator
VEFEAGAAYSCLGNYFSSMSTPDPISDLESHFGYWLRLVSNQVSHAFAARMESRGVTVAEWVILRALFGEESLNPSQLAERLELSRGAVSKLVDRLIQKRLVQCRVEKMDRRYQTLSLTAAGRKLVPSLAALADSNDEQYFGHLSAQERETLLDTLIALARGNRMRGTPLE